MSFHRRIALRLMDHAGVVMPADRKDWAEAMRAEFANIDTDREALIWAGGCVWASYRERIQPMDVFTKSLVRAAAVWLVIPTFFAVLFLLDPMPKSPFDSWKFARILSEAYGGMFAILWVCELLIARYWTTPGKLIKKTLLRSVVLWFWPVGFEIAGLIRAWADPVIHALIVAKYGTFLRHLLVDWLGHFSMYFAAIFVPLLICELLIARYWKVRQERAA